MAGGCCRAWGLQESLWRAVETLNVYIFKCSREFNVLHKSKSLPVVLIFIILEIQVFR